MEDSEPVRQSTDSTPENPPNAYVRGVNRFGFRLLAETWSVQPDQNLIFSPVSLADCLRQATFVVGGDTFRSFLETQGLNNIPIKEVVSASQALEKSLDQTRAGVNFRHRTTFWAPRIAIPGMGTAGGEGNEWLEQDLSAGDLPEQMGEWLKAYAEIDRSIPAPRQSTPDLMYLTNAAVFLGVWQLPFLRENTNSEIFHSSNGLLASVPMMNRSAWFAYHRSDEFEQVGLPFGDGRFVFHLLLPHPGIPLADLVGKLVYKRWQNWRLRPVVTRGEVTLPRVQLSGIVDISVPLSRMGIRLGSSANPRPDEDSKQTRQDRYPDTQAGVWHSSSLDLQDDVHEDTPGISLDVLMNAVQKPFNLKANRPFIFLVEDQVSQVVLLLGVLTDPQQIRESSKKTP